jgi:hypothetical protein
VTHETYLYRAENGQWNQTNLVSYEHMRRFGVPVRRGSEGPVVSRVVYHSPLATWGTGPNMRRKSKEVA